MEKVAVTREAERLHDTVNKLAMAVVFHQPVRPAAIHATRHEAVFVLIGREPADEFWQRPLVTPLRRVRRRLKQRRASPQLPWPEVIELCRGRLAEIELALEQAEQLLLERAVGSIQPGRPDDATARADLRALGLGRIIDTTETALLLELAFGPPLAAS